MGNQRSPTRGDCQGFQARMKKVCKSFDESVVKWSQNGEGPPLVLLLMIATMTIKCMKDVKKPANLQIDDPAQHITAVQGE